MNALLQQFVAEAREFLQSIGEMLIAMENDPGNADGMNELFRFVHTLKGNSGLFDFPELTRVLHAGEDLMDAVRVGRVPFTQELADRLLDAMDFVGMLIDEIDATGQIGTADIERSVALVESLRQLLATASDPKPADAVVEALPDSPTTSPEAEVARTLIPAKIRIAAADQATRDGNPLHWIVYEPEEECFFKGEDPFHLVRQVPGLLFGTASLRSDVPELAAMDAYQCVLAFRMLSTAAVGELDEHFRYVSEQVRVQALTAEQLTASGEPAVAAPTATPAAPVPAESVPVAAGVGKPALNPEETWAFNVIVEAQREILSLPTDKNWVVGRLEAVGATLSNCYRSAGLLDELEPLQHAVAEAQARRSTAPVLAWLDGRRTPDAPQDAPEPVPGKPVTSEPPPVASPAASTDSDSEIKFGRRAEDQPGSPRVVKVEQVKVDRLMNLIGEMVVAKNGLSYLAGRAESVYGARELSREIKNQFAVINRIAEEMQDAIMQVRMMPVSFIFQRFPRLVRDISRKLGKQINLTLEGEETEADKNIIEALADPLVHIVRNSLDHGIELPAVRQAAGKSAEGWLSIRATQESDRVVIEIADDGRGIDPAIIKRKAYEKGLIDEATLERISDADAVNLVFAPGFSTAEAVSDISGRGVGMDAVRAAIEKVNGALELSSEAGKGTRIQLSLPLSMAVTNVMVVESDGQIFGIPMDLVVETVRVRRELVRTIKQSQTIVLRGTIVPLRSLNELLGLHREQKVNDDDEIAVMVVRTHGEQIGIIVDDFRETVDIILKPLAGILGSLSGYAGSALLGDGSVLMVLNVKELV